MNKKLTLSIDGHLVEFAHEYSRRTKQSISSIVEVYLKKLEAQGSQEIISAKTKRLYGVLSERNLPDKKELRRRFHEKNYD